jgi:hypothetical protein
MARRAASESRCTRIRLKTSNSVAMPGSSTGFQNPHRMVAPSCDSHRSNCWSGSRSSSRRRGYTGTGTMASLPRTRSFVLPSWQSGGLRSKVQWLSLPGRTRFGRDRATPSPLDPPIGPASAGPCSSRVSTAYCRLSHLRGGRGHRAKRGRETSYSISHCRRNSRTDGHTVRHKEIATAGVPYPLRGPRPFTHPRDPYHHRSPLRAREALATQPSLVRHDFSTPVPITSPRALPSLSPN